MKKNFWSVLAAETRLKFKKPIIALAPMAGITDSAFRQICKDFGADVVYSEMISVDGINYGSKNTLELLKFTKKEKPLVIQLFGSKPEYFAKAAKIIEKLGADGIDINFGCPAPKIYRNFAGARLMRDLGLCHEIIKAAISASKLPVSIKLRVSINDEQKGRKITSLELLDKINDLPVSAVMIHGRTYEQSFSGSVDLNYIKKVKQNFQGIVLGNGGIYSPEKAKEMLIKTGVDGFGLAQGVFGKPWLFKQTKDYLRTGKYLELNLTQIKKVALKHAALNYKLKGKKGILEMRKHLGWYFKGFPGAADLRKKLVTVESLAQIKNIFAKK